MFVNTYIPLAPGLQMASMGLQLHNGSVMVTALLVELGESVALEESGGSVALEESVAWASLEESAEWAS